MSKKPKKNNVRPPGGSPTGFISFSDVLESADPAMETSPKTAADSTVYTGANPEVGLMVRKALKKDPTTRLRALRDLRSTLQVPSAPCTYDSA